MKRLIMFAVLFVGCVPAAAIRQAKTQHAVNAGHARDALLPPTARAIAEDAEDAWAVQAFSLDGTALPEATVARLTARGQLPEGYGE